MPEYDPERDTVLSKIRKCGPISHSKLADTLGMEWDRLQQTIRVLRTEGEVEITIDRRYVHAD